MSCTVSSGVEVETVPGEANGADVSVGRGPGVGVSRVRSAVSPTLHARVARTNETAAIDAYRVCMAISSTPQGRDGGVHQMVSIAFLRSDFSWRGKSVRYANRKVRRQLIQKSLRVTVRQMRWGRK